MVAPTITREAVQEAWLGGQRSPRTVDAYRRDTDEWFAWCDHHGYDAMAATRVEVDRFRGWLKHHRRRGGPVSDATLARKLTALSSLYTYALEDLAVVDRNPVARVKRPVRDEESPTHGMELDEAQAFLAASARLGPMPNALAQVLLSTGMRISEVCAADTEDLGRDRGHRVLTVVRKGGRRQRLPLVPAAVDALDAYLGGRGGPLFLSKRVRLYRQEAWRIVTGVASMAAIPDKRISPHSLRHTAITVALDAGVPLHLVQEMAGHRDPRTTNRYDRHRNAIDRSPVHVLGELLASP